MSDGRSYATLQILTALMKLEEDCKCAFVLLYGLWKLVACQDDGDIVDSTRGESQIDQ